MTQVGHSRRRSVRTPSQAFRACFRDPYRGSVRIHDPLDADRMQAYLRRAVRLALLVAVVIFVLGVAVPLLAHATPRHAAPARP